MTNSVRIIDMAPFGKARPRVTRNGTFMPKQYKARIEELQWRYGPVEVEGPCIVNILAVRPMPRSWSQAKRNHANGLHTTAKPDADNIAGAVMDALFPERTGGDGRVVGVICQKVWGEVGQLRIDISPAEAA